MNKADELWYKLLTTLKQELNLNNGISIPFMVGAYDLACNGVYNWKSKDGLKKIFEIILSKRESGEELAIMRCQSFTNGDVYIVMLLSEIDNTTANCVRENRRICDNFYTTLDVSDIYQLVDLCWNKYQSCILANNFSAYRTDPLWRPFSEHEKQLIMSL